VRDEGGLHEDIDLTNFTQREVSFQLALELDADFADIEEAGGERRQDGVISRTWRMANPARPNWLSHTRRSMTTASKVNPEPSVSDVEFFSNLRTPASRQCTPKAA
jgi:hypothetical protein